MMTERQKTVNRAKEDIQRNDISRGHDLQLVLWVVVARAGCKEIFGPRQIARS